MANNITRTMTPVTGALEAQRLAAATASADWLATQKIKLAQASLGYSETIEGGYYLTIDGTAVDCWNRPLSETGILLSTTPKVRDNLP